MALPEVVSSEEWLKAGLPLLAWLSDCDAGHGRRDHLTKLGAPRHAETPRSGDIPEHWPRRRFSLQLQSCLYP